VIIEFCGSPKSGKSSAITSLSIFLKRNGYKVHVLKEYASVCPISDKQDWLFNTWTACRSLAGLLPFLDPQAAGVDVVLIDRGILDALCWFAWLEGEQNLDREISRAIGGMLHIARFREAIDLVLVFLADPDKSIDREYANLLTWKSGSIMNVPVLASYRKAVIETVERQGRAFKKIVKIDTSELLQREVGLRVTQETLDALKVGINEEIAYIHASELRRRFGGGTTSSLSKVISHPLHLRFASRKTVEANRLFVQPVAIAVVTDASRTKVLALRKSSVSLGKEDSPERDKVLLYAGGHIRVEDSRVASGRSLEDVARKTLERELREELGTALKATKDQVLCIWDTTHGAKSQKHVGVCFVCEVDFKVFEPKLDAWEFGNEDPTREAVQVVNVAELDLDELEPWSYAIYEAVLAPGSEMLF
jgi:predicted NUDIX family phosphoesterase